MTKRIIVSLVMIALVIAGVTGATVAYFSSTATSSGNTFTAGTLDLTIDESGTVPINLTNMQPGDTVSGSMTVENTGSLAGWLGIRSSYEEADGEPNDSNMTDDQVAKMLIITAFTADGDDVLSIIPNDDDDGKITVFDMVNDDSAGPAPYYAVGTWYSYDADMLPEETHTYSLTIEFDTGAGNAYQADGIVWTFEFLLDQK